MGPQGGLFSNFTFMTLPKSLVGLLAMTAGCLLSSCSAQKRTTAPGWHIERASRHALSVQVHTPKQNDNLLLERSDLQKLTPVVPRALKSMKVPRVDKRLVMLCQDSFAHSFQAQEVHEDRDIRCVVPEQVSKTSTTSTTGIMPIPSWQEEVLWLLESARKKRRLGVVCLTYGISWLVAAKHQKKAEQLCERVGSNLETAAPEALQRANEMRQKRLNRGIAWFLSGCAFMVLAGLLFVGLSTGFWIGIG